MAIIEFEEENDWADMKDWLLLIAYIAAKRTHEPLFKKLLDKLLQEEDHLFHRQTKNLQMRYDFTPLKTFDDFSGNKGSGKN